MTVTGQRFDLAGDGGSMRLGCEPDGVGGVIAVAFATRQRRASILPPSYSEETLVTVPIKSMLCDMKGFTPRCSLTGSAII